MGDRLFPARMLDRFTAYDPNGRQIEAGAPIPADTPDWFVRDLLRDGVAELLPEEA